MAPDGEEDASSGQRPGMMTLSRLHDPPWKGGERPSALSGRLTIGRGRHPRHCPGLSSSGTSSAARSAWCG